ncbi:ricin-type beta-trefoil lectin domain protein [Actinoplanes sp. NPDC051343]|uniref:ricin-type beta-trefoil lectin domain protein n=1 Tax=Actinoplanes sp. NPDC051343 TaxID=3363906 RepID=UPI00379067AB
MAAALAVGIVGFAQAQASTGAAPGAAGAIRGFGGLCLEADPTAGVTVKTCADTPGQRWTEDPKEHRLQALGKCLDVAESAITNGSNLQLADCTDSESQQFRFSGGEWVNGNAAKCLDVTDFRDEDGAPVQIWTCTFGANQRWTRPGAGTIEPGDQDHPTTNPGSTSSATPEPSGSNTGAPDATPGPSGSASADPSAAPSPGDAASSKFPPVSPYLYTGWGNPPNPATVMNATGVKAFTMAFMLDGGNCTPKWDAGRPLLGGADEAAIRRIRAAGGDVVVSFGGANGRSLEAFCPDDKALAAAYEKVVDAYQLKVIDIDIEGAPYGQADVQQRMIDALKALHSSHAGIKIYITLSSGTGGPDGSLITRAARAGLSVDNWSAMTFDWENTTGDQGQLTGQAADGLMARLRQAYGMTTDEAYRHTGISSMNGRTDQNAVVNLQDAKTITEYAGRHHLGRLAFWSVNRDRQCGGSYNNDDSCSGISQADWAFTKILAGYHG